MDDAYLKGDPDFVGRSTVPAIVDVKTGAAVQNEAVEIPKYFITDWEEYHKERAPQLYPKELRDEIDEWSDFINSDVNAYACGFARSQDQYDKGFEIYFNALDKLEERLNDRRFVNGDYITLSDIHLYVALIRFHVNYHLVFGVNKKRLEDYPNLWGYTRDIYQTRGFYEFTKLPEIKKHYQLSPHMRAKLGNVYGLLGVGPDNRELLLPTGREKLSGDPKHKFLYKKEDRKTYLHEDENIELSFLNEYLLKPIEKAKEATYQNELERWAHQVEDVFISIDHRLRKQKYLLGDRITKADKVFYQTIKRFDNIYYYINKLNFAKSRDYANISRYIKELDNVNEIADSINIKEEIIESYKALDDDRNPYHLVFGGEDI